MIVMNIIEVQCFEQLVGFLLWNGTGICRVLGLKMELKLLIGNTRTGNLDQKSHYHNALRYWLQYTSGLLALYVIVLVIPVSCLGCVSRSTLVRKRK